MARYSSMFGIQQARYSNYLSEEVENVVSPSTVAGIVQSGFYYRVLLKGSTDDVDVNNLQVLPSRRALATRVQMPNLPPLIIPGEKSEYLRVRVACIDEPAIVFVQLENKADLIMKITERIQELVRRRPKAILNPAAGSVVLARFDGDNYYYRASIIHKCDIQCIEVFFIDYGNIRQVSEKDILPVDEFLLQIPPQAISLAIKGVDQSSVQSEELKNLLQNRSVYIRLVSTDKDREAFLVNMYLLSKNGDAVDVARVINGECSCPALLPRGLNLANSASWRENEKDSSAYSPSDDRTFQPYDWRGVSSSGTLRDQNHSDLSNSLRKVRANYDGRSVSSAKSGSSYNEDENRHSDVAGAGKRCFNCGALDHLSRSCPFADRRQPRSFASDAYGRECSTRFKSEEIRHISRPRSNGFVEHEEKRDGKFSSQKSTFFNPKLNENDSRFGSGVGKIFKGTLSSRASFKTLTDQTSERIENKTILNPAQDVPDTADGSSTIPEALSRFEEAHLPKNNDADNFIGFRSDKSETFDPSSFYVQLVAHKSILDNLVLDQLPSGIFKGTLSSRASFKTLTDQTSERIENKTILNPVQDVPDTADGSSTIPEALSRFEEAHLPKNNDADNFIGFRSDKSETFDPSSFYVQLAAHKSILDNLVLDQLPSGVSNLDSFEKGMACIAFFFGTYYRGEIVESVYDDTERHKVRFVDWGNEEIVENAFIYKLDRSFPPKFRVPNRYSFHCSLEGLSSAINEKHTVENANPELSKLTLDKPLSIRFVRKLPEGMFSVDVVLDNGETIFEVLSRSSLGPSVSLDQEPKPEDSVKEPKVESSLLRIGNAQLDSIYFGVPLSGFRSDYSEQADPNSFYVQLIRDQNIVEKLSLNVLPPGAQVLKSYEKKLACAAFYPEDSRYYRAEFISSPEDSERIICFVDYGNILKLENEDVYRIDDKFPKFFHSQLRYAFHCKLANVLPVEGKDSFSYEARIEFSDLTSGDEMKICFLREVVEGLLEVELYNENGESISQKLCERGFALPMNSSLPCEKINSHSFEDDAVKVRFRNSMVRDTIEHFLTCIFDQDEKDAEVGPVVQ